MQAKANVRGMEPEKQLPGSVGGSATAQPHQSSPPAHGHRVLQCKGCQWKQAAIIALVGHSLYVGIGSVQQMVGRDGREFGSQSGTAQRHNLVGMEFQRVSPISLWRRNSRRDCPMEKDALFVEDVKTQPSRLNYARYYRG